MLPLCHLPICCRQPQKADGHVTGASVNESHSFPAAGIWHVIVLGHRGRSDAICWHVLPQPRLLIPLSPRKQQKSRKGSQNRHGFITKAPGAGSWERKPACLHVFLHLETFPFFSNCKDTQVTSVLGHHWKQMFPD